MKTLYVIFFLIILSGLVSCYDDKGNYAYTDVFEIKVDSIRENYSLYFLKDTLKINPIIAPDNVEFDFHWCVYPKDKSGDDAILDTLDVMTQNLVMPMNLEPGSYGIVFMAREKATGITEIKETSLTVTTSLSEGWYVLHSQNGSSDLDLFSTKLGKIENIIAANNEGRQLKGEAVGVDYDTEYKVWDDASEAYVNTKTLIALSDNDAVTLGTFNGEIIRDMDDLFYEQPTVINPQDIYVNSAQYFFLNDGKIHIIDGLNKNSGRFGSAARGDYQLSRFRIFGWSNSLTWDTKSSSFVSISVMGGDVAIEHFSEKGENEEIICPPVSNLDADLLYLGAGPWYAGWAILKKKNEDIWLLYNLNANNAQSPFYNPALKSDTLDSSLKMLQADLWASSINNNIIYFAKDGIIYSCNIDAGYVEKQQMVIPEGEITYMRNLTFSGEDNSFNNLVVATFDGTRYKIYLYEIQAGNIQSEPKVLEGEGRVGGLVYINDAGKTKLY